VSDPTEKAAGVLEPIFTVALVPFAAFYIWQAMQVTEPPRNIIVGPRTFPLLIGALMLVVSAVLAVRQLRVAAGYAGRRTGPVSGGVPLEDEEMPIRDWTAVGLVLAALLGLFIVFEPLGFVAAISAFVFGLATFFAPRQWLLNLTVALIFSVSFFYLFTTVLGIPLPRGVFELLTD
jgi:putative tricarboxylic transport membrane protein